MESVQGKVAVITGAASGMGRAFAECFGRAGASIIAADVEEPALNEAVEEMQAAGIDVMGVMTDVSSESSMDALGAAAFARHDTVHLLFNNAGVGGGGRIIDCTTADWQWVLGVNLWGVVHGLRVFLPHMVEHGDAHIINTASVAGHTSLPGLGPYSASKHAVVTISETLKAELAADESTVGVSVLCPGIVNTKILQSDRNRPETLTKPGTQPEPTEEELAIRELAEAFFAQGMKPEPVADLVLQSVLSNQFYIFTDDVHNGAIQARHEAIRNRTDPPTGQSLVDIDL